MTGYCPDCGNTACICPTCDEKRPCRPEYRSDDDLCCAHGGSCVNDQHEHYDREEHSDALIEAHLLRRKEGPRP